MLWNRFDGSDHALEREPHLTRGEAERVERAVASLLPGPPDTHRVVAVEKRQVLVKSSEVVMVNGKSIELEGQEGMKILIIKQLLSICIFLKRFEWLFLNFY